MLMEIPHLQRQCNIDTPSICPTCHLGIIPQFLTGIMIPDMPIYSAIFSCPSCNSVIFASYQIRENYEGLLVTGSPIVFPPAAPTVDIPSEMNEYFPEFFELYQQSASAEAAGLHQICGMGYRKALETLVKTHLCSEYPDESAAILSETLAQSINRLSGYPKIHALAKAASWIGNDYAHIVKKHPDRDISDMKAFTLALCHLILAEKEADNALSMLNAPAGTSPRNTPSNE